MANKASSHGEILPNFTPPERWDDMTVRATMDSADVRELPFHDGWRQWRMAKNLQNPIMTSVRTLQEIRETVPTNEERYRAWEDTHPSPLRAD
jgi:hypothetical protein